MTSCSGILYTLNICNVFPQWKLSKAFFIIDECYCSRYLFVLHTFNQPTKSPKSWDLVDLLDLNAFWLWRRCGSRTGWILFSIIRFINFEVTKDRLNSTIVRRFAQFHFLGNRNKLIIDHCSDFSMLSKSQLAKFRIMSANLQCFNNFGVIRSVPVSLPSVGFFKSRLFKKQNQ